METFRETYVNFSSRVPDRDRVVQEVCRLGRTAFVTPVQGGYVLACDREPELGRMPVEEVAALYSLALNTPIFVTAREPGSFCFWLVEGKKLSASYLSSEVKDCREDGCEDEIPEIIADQKRAARRISEVLASPSVAGLVEDIFLHPERFASPVKQHAALVEVLGLPPWSLGAGYGAFCKGQFPAGLAADQVIRVG